MENPYVLDPTGADVQGEAAKLRERGPVTPVELPGGVAAWAVTGQEELKGLLADPMVSKNPNLHWAAWINGEIPPDWPLALWVSVQNMFTAYGDDHRRLRTIISRAFTPRRTEALRPAVAEITRDLVAALAAAPGGRADLREEFAYPLPIEVICRLFGVPDETRPSLRRCVDGVFNTALTAEQSLANQQVMYGILQDLVEFRRREPADDLAGVLISARDEEGSRLSENELVDTLILMISAGHETTVNLLDQAIVAMLTHPEQYARVRSGEVPWDEVIEETLRWQPPVANLPLRYAVEDIEVGGATIRKGEAILAAYAAAGRDRALHGDDADAFDIARADKEHLSFGYGVHFCVGKHLARMEAEISLPALFGRFPDMALAVDPGELRQVESFISNGHRELPVILNS
ncbi:cytochrome P450 family protein [Actinomadura livida]|uniref:Cytochrome P450 n=1 Tax=Actinomadura livida TaxID=79909 RepID=A0A7W7ICF2_9ACTN|nr:MULTISPECIES: cytochrome P450 [Actinomadura]MBB4774552.1 cytochrome P450 [Actinomadura catellatispora]GGU07556.1 cytochrome P450 [Actinomadura livida]